MRKERNTAGNILDELQAEYSTDLETAEHALRESGKALPTRRESCFLTSRIDSRVEPEEA